MNIYPYVYRLDHPVTKEFYIGFRCANKLPAASDLGHKYFTSSHYVKPRFGEFTITIIAEFFDKEAAYDFEQSLIHEAVGDALLLNKNCRHGGKNRFLCDKEVGKKISKTIRGKKRGPCSEVRRKAISDSNMGKVLSDEHKRKIGEANKGKTKSIEHRASMSEARKGKTKSAEWQAKINASLQISNKPIMCCRLRDKKEMNVGNLMRWD